MITEIKGIYGTSRAQVRLCTFVFVVKTKSLCEKCLVITLVI